MENGTLPRYLPTMGMLAEEFDRKGWNHRLTEPDPAHIYRGVALYTGQRPLQRDLVYLLPEGAGKEFPTDEFAFVAVESVAGKANHILCPLRKKEEVLALLLETFDRYREQEARMDRLVMSGGSLDALCALGEELGGNPVCIHDDWFIIIAMSPSLPQAMPPERVADSNKGFIPRVYIDSFKNNADYNRTFERRTPGVWYANEDKTGDRCLFMNLWEGDRYRGRLLILETEETFRPSHTLLTDCLASRAMLLLTRQKGGERREFRNMDDIAFSLLSDERADAAEVNLFLETLHWRRTDRFLCIQLQTQQTDAAPVMDHVLHSELFQLFPDSYIMFVEQRQCIILNLSKETIPVTQVRHRLAAVCRDYYMYAGISSPVWGADELRYAFRQTAIALEQAFFLRNERWVIPFSTIVLDYALRKLPGDLPPGYMVAPELLELLVYDRKKGTEYFGTLRAWLLCERDIPRTSEALIIHRTTLLYRLKKIQAQTGLNLDDPDERLYLLLSLKMLSQMDYATADVPRGGRLETEKPAED